MFSFSNECEYIIILCLCQEKKIFFYIGDRMNEKRNFWDKATIIITGICIIAITIAGTILLKMESASKSVIIKSENSSIIENEIDKTEQSETSDGDYSTEIYGLININTADKETLMLLSGIGEKRATDIIEYRKLNPFNRIEEITNISGIGEKTFEKIKDKICVN